jgi:hypothetical protein
MKHRFTLTYQTRGTAKQARDSLLDALTSGGLREIDVKVAAIRKPCRAHRRQST